MNIFQDLKLKLEKGFEQAGSKSQRVLEVSRLGLKVKSKKEDLAELMVELGETVYDSWQSEQTIQETDQLQTVLQSVHALSQEIEQLEQEMGRWKSSNIETRTKAETVKISASAVDDTLQKTDDVHTTPKVVYLCPFCAKQVTKQVSKCPHCEKGYY